MASRSHQRSLPGLDDPAADAAPEGAPGSGTSRLAGPPSGTQPGTAASTVTTVAAAAPDQPPANIEGWQVYVVDAHSLIHQVFHALPEMTSPRGEPVGAVYGFVRDILYLIDQKRPDALICAFDRPGPTFRNELFAGYKSDRAAMPDELVGQIPKVHEVLSALSIPAIGMDGFEADDVLATIARLCNEAGAWCYLVTGDKDCRQLITDRVAVYNIRKDEVFGVEALEEEWGVRPDQVVDFQALVGDKVDNVPGVPTIGPKTAQTLLKQYGTLDILLAHAVEVPGAKGKALVEGREVALLSRELVRLDSLLPIQPDWNASRIGSVDQQRLAELFAGFGFRTFGQRFAQVSQAETPAGWQANYRCVNTPAGLAELVEKMSRQPLISVDTETTHVMPRWAEIVGYSFAWKAGEAYYVPVRGPAGERVLDPAETLAALRPVLENPAIAKVGQNLKYDMIVLRTAGVELAGVTFDTMVASYLLDAGERNHSLDDLSERYLNHRTIKISELIGKGKDQRRMDDVPLAQITPYACEDADMALRLRPLLAARLDEAGLTDLNAAVEVPLIGVLVDLESNGVRVEPARLAELSQRYSRRLAELEVEIERLAGHPLNIASPKQLAQVLFQELGLPVMKKTKTGPSTDADVLEQLAAIHELPAKIIEYRQFAKLKNTYVDALPAMIHPDTGRVHASFNQVVAATGRLSSSDPNLQNIPIRTEEGREIRSAFVAGPPGWKLLAADYSQIELRVLAHYSQDSALCEAFARDEDIHTLVASQVFGVPLGEVTSAQRRSAKAVNFGVIYGQSPFGLAKSLGISQEEAAAFIDGYFERYPGVTAFIDQTLAECYRQRYVTTILGRRRAIQGVRELDQVMTRSPDRATARAGSGDPRTTGGSPRTSGRRPLNLPERTAVNTVIQGSAADLIKLAMVAVAGRLRAERLQAKMILQIHDELVFEVAPDAVGALAKLVEEEMRGVMALRVPLKVDVKCGDNWAECG